MNTATKLSRLSALRLSEQEQGQGLVEYSLIILLVCLVVISALGAFGGSLGILYEYITTELPF